MRKTASVLLLLAIALGSAAAVDVVFSGKTDMSASVPIPPADDPWKISGASLMQSFGLDVYGDMAALHLDAGFSFDSLSESLKPFVSEVYADYYPGRLSFRFGRQKATWGTAEIESAVDVITPSDMSDPLNMSKAAIDALKITFDAFPLSFDFYWIPLFTPAVLPASAAALFEAYSIELKKPETKLSNGEAGMKASAYTSAGDFALYGYYGWEDVPSMTGEYERLAMAGASAAVPVGEVTLKAEGAWYPKRDKVVSATAGLEWMHEDLTFVGEVYGEWDKKTEKLSGQVGASVTYGLLDGDLELSLAGILELKVLDGAAVAGAEYSFTDELKAQLQAVYVFEGPDEPGTYGAFRNLSCVRLGATFSF